MKNLAAKICTKSGSNWKKTSLLIFLLLVVAGITIWSFFPGSLLPRISPIATPGSQVSPLRAQAVEESFDNLDGVGEIKWYDDFFLWQPRAQVRAYPFISGTVAIFWDDIDTGLSPVAVPYTTTVVLVVELELRGTETYTQKIEYDDIPQYFEPGIGNVYNPQWVWINKAPGTYDEYIKAYWQVGNDTELVYFVDNGQIVEPVTNFVLYREGLVIPDLIYLPVVMKRAP